MIRLINVLTVPLMPVILFMGGVILLFNPTTWKQLLDRKQFSMVKGELIIDENASAKFDIAINALGLVKHKWTPNWKTDLDCNTWVYDLFTLDMSGCKTAYLEFKRLGLRKLAALSLRNYRGFSKMLPTIRDEFKGLKG